jgi:hypothetical protein
MHGAADRSLTMTRALLWGVPATVLATAFVGLCVMTGTPWPWTRVVHEDGVRTLLGTVFYFEHATRELLPDVLLALATAGAVRFFFPPSGGDRADAARRRWRLAIVSTLVLATILIGTALTEGSAAIAHNLSQLHTRAGAPLVWGAHWRYHLIERLAQIMLAFCIAGVVWILKGRPDTGAAGKSRLYVAALLLFAGATALFKLTDEPFRDPVFLGHQVRELFTHGLVTLPLSLAVCLGLAERFSTATDTASNGGTWAIVATGLIGVVCAVFLLMASLGSDAQSHGQTPGLASLLLPHFAEHAFSYVLVPALAGAIYLWPARRRL